MRKCSDEILTEIADKDDKVRLVIADVGMFEKFKSKHPDKYLNVGVAEADAIGIAAGMASQGLRVFVFGVSSFFIYRAFEQFKLTVAYWNNPITFLGVGFGWKFYYIGTGHFSPDDLTLMRLMPNMKVFAPHSNSELKDLLMQKNSEPRYIRLSRNQIETSINMDLTKDRILISYGEMVKNVEGARKLLEEEGFSFGFAYLNDINEESIQTISIELADKEVYVVEDQYKIGSFGSILCSCGIKIKYHKTLPITTNKIANTKIDLYKCYGLDEESIYADIKKIVEN